MATILHRKVKPHVMKFMKMILTNAPKSLPHRVLNVLVQMLKLTNVKRIKF